MIHSMTGFGKATCELPGKKITIEIKSLNSKQNDISTRIPGIYKEKDLIIRNMISQKLQRGKVEFNLFVENLGEEASICINSGVVAAYFKQIKELSKTLNIPEPEDYFSTLLKMPEALKAEIKEIDESEWATIASCISDAIDDLCAYRMNEGEAMEADLVGRVDAIQALKAKVIPFEGERIERVKQRIMDNFAELSDKIELNDSRLEQEMIFYMEKFDINEEKVRLDNHCKYFLETIAQGAGVGKKLGFISQEMGREINTMGSKANHPEIQKLVVMMKDELEKIKEQALNVL